MDSLSQRVWIEDLASDGKDAADVIVRAIVIDLLQGSGLLRRCPECRRVLRRGLCRVHGEGKGEYDLRVKAVLDDGSGALVAVFDRGLTESLFGKTLDACVAQAKQAMSMDAVRDALADVLVAQPMEVHGKVVVGDDGVMLFAKEARILRAEPELE